MTISGGVPTYTDLSMRVTYTLQVGEKPPMCLSCNHTIQPDEVYTLIPPNDKWPLRAGHTWPRPYQGNSTLIWLDWRLKTPRRIRDTGVALHRNPCLQTRIPGWPGLPGLRREMDEYFAKYPKRRYIGPGRPVNRDGYSTGMTQDEMHLAYEKIAREEDKRRKGMY